jgi:hypothetical protein
MAVHGDFLAAPTARAMVSRIQEKFDARAKSNSRDGGPHPTASALFMLNIEELIF